MTGEQSRLLRIGDRVAGVAQQLILARSSELLGAESPLLGMTVSSTQRHEDN